jgi:hypothetical protein
MKQIPDNMSLHDQLLFNITLLYPQSPIPAQVDSFATYLPLFTQTFDDFGEYVTFKKVSIEGPVSRIVVGVSGHALFIPHSFIFHLL